MVVKRASFAPFRVDVDRANNGVWKEIGHGVEFKIGAWMNDRHREALSKRSAVMKEQIRQWELDGMEEDKTIAEYMDEMDKMVAAEGLVFGWRGVNTNPDTGEHEPIWDDDGNAIEFSPERCLDILRDPELQRVWVLVKMHANTEANFRKEEEEAEKGN
jgi:hypothetical protein